MFVMVLISPGRRKKEEGRRKKEGGRRKEEGRKKEEEGRKKEEGKRKKNLCRTSILSRGKWHLPFTKIIWV